MASSTTAFDISAVAILPLGVGGRAFTANVLLLLTVLVYVFGKANDDDDDDDELADP